MSTAVAGRRWCLSVPHHARGARAARHRLTAVLTGIIPAEVLVDAAAVAAELVGNAVRHASALPGGIIQVEWKITGAGGVAIRVRDGGSTVAPEVQHPDAEAVSGRGLTIVEALAEAWGVERDGSGQCVWADVRGVGLP